jgi:hypothetical protein
VHDSVYFDTSCTPGPKIFNDGIFFFREKSRVVLLPFPAISEPTEIGIQLTYLQQLESARKRASRAIGLLVSLGKELKSSNTFINDKCIPIISECLDKEVGPRVMKNYIILMFFIQKVSFIYNSCAGVILLRFIISIFLVEDPIIDFQRMVLTYQIL